MAGPAINLAAGVGVLAEVSLTARGVGASQPDAAFDIVPRMVDSPPLNCQRGYSGSPLEMILRLQQIAECGWLPAWAGEPYKCAVPCSGGLKLQPLLGGWLQYRKSCIGRRGNLQEQVLHASHKECYDHCNLYLFISGG